MIGFSKFPVDVVPFGRPVCRPLFYINRGILSKWDITVAALSQTELYKYDWRIDLFLKKFSGKEEFELNSGKMVKFVYDKKTADLVSKKKDINCWLFLVSFIFLYYNVIFIFIAREI